MVELDTIKASDAFGSGSSPDGHTIYVGGDSISPPPCLGIRRGGRNNVTRLMLRVVIAIPSRDCAPYAPRLHSIYVGGEYFFSALFVLSVIMHH